MNVMEKRLESARGQQNPEPTAGKTCYNMRRVTLEQMGLSKISRSKAKVVRYSPSKYHGTGRKHQLFHKGLSTVDAIGRSTANVGIY